MPIQFPEMMSVPSAEEHKPFLNQLMKAMQFGLGFPRQLQQADIGNALKNVELQYAPDTAQETLFGKQLENQKANILLPFVSEQAKAQILEMQLNQEKQRMLMNAVKKIMQEHGMIPGDNQQQGGTTSNQSTNLTGGGNILPTPNNSYGGRMPPNELQQYMNNAAMSTGGQANPVQGATIPVNQLGNGQKQVQQAPQQQQPQQVQPIGNQQPTPWNYQDLSLLSHFAGYGKPDIQEVPGTGRKEAFTPFGVATVLQGLNAQQQALQAGLGTGTAKAYGDSITASQGLRKQGMALDMMTKSLDNPEFLNVTGPVAARWLKYFGSPQQKELLGTLNTSSGEVMLQISPSIKGAWTGKDQTMVNGIKANPTDNPYVFIGKLKAQKIIGDALIDREERAQEYMFQGIPQHQAYKKATAETPLDKYEKVVNDLINPKVDKLKSSAQKYSDKDITEENIQHTMKEMNLPRSEVLKRLKAKGYKIKE